MVDLARSSKRCRRSDNNKVNRKFGSNEPQVDSSVSVFFRSSEKGSTEKGGQGVQNPLIKAVGRVGKRKKRQLAKKKEGKQFSSSKQ